MSAVFGPEYSPSALRAQLDRSIWANSGGAVIFVVSETVARGDIQSQMLAMSLGLRLIPADDLNDPGQLTHRSQAVFLSKLWSPSWAKAWFESFVGAEDLASPRIMVIQGTVDSLLPAEVLASDPVIVDADAAQLSSLGVEAEYLAAPQSLMKRVSVALGGFGSTYSMRDLMVRQAGRDLSGS